MRSEKSTITVEKVCKSFGKKEVLHGLCFDLAPGEVFGLVGLNGAGKTTVIRILLGLLKPDGGSCRVLGRNPALQERDYFRRIGVVLEHNGFFGNLTVRDNLAFFAEARGVSKKETHEYFDRYWECTDIGRDTRSVKYFSRGQKMQCALCRAFLGRPEVFFFDEPVVALDIEAYGRFCDMVGAARVHGATVIISSHQLDAIEDLCTRVGILENGAMSLLQTANDRTAAYWLVKADYAESCREGMERITGHPARYEKGAWVLRINGNGEQAVADIIALLVSAGCRVYEARPLKQGFRDSIQRHFSGGGS